MSIGSNNLGARQRLQILSTQQHARNLVEIYVLVPALPTISLGCVGQRLCHSRCDNVCARFEHGVRYDSPVMTLPPLPIVVPDLPPHSPSPPRLFDDLMQPSRILPYSNKYGQPRLPPKRTPASSRSALPLSRGSGSGISALSLTLTMERARSVTVCWRSQARSRH